VPQLGQVVVGRAGVCVRTDISVGVRMRGMEFEIPGLGREKMAAVNGNVDGVFLE
jgi:hypothetical protein